VDRPSTFFGDPAAGWIADLAARMKIELQVANPSHQGWRWRSVKKKTDRVDGGRNT